MGQGHPSEKYERQLGWLATPISMGKFKKWQPNHQPVIHFQTHPYVPWFYYISWCLITSQLLTGEIPKSHAHVLKSSRTIFHFIPIISQYSIWSNCMIYIYTYIYTYIYIYIYIILMYVFLWSMHAPFSHTLFGQTRPKINTPDPQKRYEFNLSSIQEIYSHAYWIPFQKSY